ncbi:MAG TPA: 50S ribosomal protein L22 [Dehalococcoidia bacterium]|jgi:large subunit ribosomal protein L22|nr:50S ribosomal protein L22 [Dehalococcoidia bacterium]|tara:strand:- start:62 stop:409 length:348 start_codon:yes stop_codon:yes gene_type:complete
MPEVKATQKSIGASVKRLRPMMDLVKGQQVDTALTTLQFLTSPWAKVISKVVKSAVANAENNMMMDRRQLKITQIFANQAKPLKRFRPRARGRIGRITKPSSHITVIVNQIGEGS